MIFLLGAGSAFAQPSFTEMRSAWERQVKKVEVSALFAQDKIKPAYQRMVQSEMKKVQAAGKLEALIALKDERARTADDLTVADPPSEMPEVLRLQELLAEQLQKIEATRSEETLKYSRVYRKQLGELQSALTKQGDIESALIAKQERAKLLLRPEFRFLSRLAVRGANPDAWHVVFRGKNPFKFGMALSTDLTHAILLEQVPKDMKYMRLANLGTQDFVVLELSRDEFINGMTEGNYQWRFGTNETHAVLGVADFKEQINNRRGEAYFSARGDGGYSGWGYAPRKAYPTEGDENQEVVIKQGLCWDRENQRSLILLEVSVSSAPLSEIDQAKLLINPARKPVNKPAVAAAAGNLPERLPRSLLLTPADAKLTGATKKLDGGIQIGDGANRGRLTWDMTKIRQGTYDVHVTYSSKSGGLLTAQGARPTMASRTKILLDRVNLVTRKTREQNFRRDVFAKIKLGGFNNLELILSPRTGYRDSATIHRVEVTAPAR